MIARETTPMAEDIGGTDRIERAARRLDAALEALDAALAQDKDGAPARREVEVMAEDRARMAEELIAARGQREALRDAGRRALDGVREARQAVHAVLEEER
ncbi:MAG: DUF4164 family protein [Pseudomonadota bacterium]